MTDILLALRNAQPLQERGSTTTPTPPVVPCQQQSQVVGYSNHDIHHFGNLQHWRLAFALRDQTPTNDEIKCSNLMRDFLMDGVLMEERSDIAFQLKNLGAKDENVNRTIWYQPFMVDTLISDFEDLLLVNRVTIHDHPALRYMYEILLIFVNIAMSPSLAYPFVYSRAPIVAIRVLEDHDHPMLSHLAPSALGVVLAVLKSVSADEGLNWIIDSEVMGSVLKIITSGCSGDHLAIKILCFFTEQTRGVEFISRYIARFYTIHHALVALAERLKNKKLDVESEVNWFRAILSCYFHLAIDEEIKFNLKQIWDRFSNVCPHARLHANDDECAMYLRSLDYWLGSREFIVNLNPICVEW